MGVPEVRLEEEQPPLSVNTQIYFTVFGISSTQGCLMGICLTESFDFLTSPFCLCAFERTCGLSSSFLPLLAGNEKLSSAHR